LQPAHNILAFYAGRVEGEAFSSEPNWVDDGAISLGTASFAIIDGNEALVYDTHVSVEIAKQIRDILKQRGIDKITVLLSHWHLDHVAGNEAFADCEIIANARTLKHLEDNKSGIEDGSFHGAPAIKPLVLPSRVFSGEMEFHLGKTILKFVEANIHSDDASLIWMEDQRILFAGDTMEDTVTYVGEPQNFDIHLADLDRLWALQPVSILPNHGHPEVIAKGGYGKSLIRAQQQYIRTLRRCATEPELASQPLRNLISGPLEAGWVNYFAPYKRVHEQNLARVTALKPRT
jgi:glyoxylase-like metal-dependent hydrolase (beta-lactamase superfamily II)